MARKPTDLQRLMLVLQDGLISASEMNRDKDPAGVVDGLYEIARALRSVARAIRETRKDALKRFRV